MGRLVIVTGPPGAGKSTVARRLAAAAEAPLSMHMHTDDLYAYVRKGFVEPWRPESSAQNFTLMKAMAASAVVCAAEGYEVVVDGIIGPWFLPPWIAAARGAGLALHYVALMPGEAVAVARATARTAPGALTDTEVVRRMWRVFESQPPEARHRLDTSGQTPAETAAAVSAGLAEGRFRLF